MTEDWKAAWAPVIALVGQDISSGETRAGADRIEAGAIRRYLEPLEFDCPLHHDTDVARARGHADIIAPYTAIATLAMRPSGLPADTFSRAPNAMPSPINHRSSPPSRRARHR